MKDLTHISLFAGIGGIDIAAEWAGFRTILFVEIDPFCQKVLRRHWPNVPIIGDIRDATKEKIMVYAQSNGFRQGRASSSDQIQQKNEASKPQVGCGGEYGSRGTDRTEQPVTLITGGFPCQPVSQAGKRGGKEDDRWLWPDMFRVISEVRPAWVVAENVTGLLTMGFYDCLSDLEGEGYETIPFVIPACGVNAPHRRDRIFIVANSKCQRWGGGHNGDEGGGRRSLQTEGPSAGDKQGDVADTEGIRPQESRETRSGWAGFKNGSWWAVEPELGRVAYGIPSRVDRLKCLGNAVVPQQIYPILKAIADIEKCSDGSIL